jgi:hypothetical protein
MLQKSFNAFASMISDGITFAQSSAQETRLVALNASGSWRDRDLGSVLSKPSHFPQRVSAMHVKSREYKVMVDSSLCIDLKAALSSIRHETEDLARSLGLGFAGQFDAEDPKERTILFLDTPDFTVRQNGLLLRQRVKCKSGTTEYTLKCRTPDRYIAAGRDLSPGPKLAPESKLEEDIGVPFISRFSHSTTVSLDAHQELAGKNYPTRLSTAARLFPGLLALQRDGLPCAPETALTPVRGLNVFEQVFNGPKVHFPRGRSRSSPMLADVALILWSKSQKGRVLTAELSFRYEAEKEAFPADVASGAKRFFEGLQYLDWTRPEAITKTQYMYGGM